VEKFKQTNVMCYYVMFLCTTKYDEKHLQAKCHNLNIGFTTKCEVQGTMRARMCLGVKHTFTNGGECKG
jgi:hypothetical protein